VEVDIYQKLKYLKNAIIIFVACFALNYFSIIDFRALLKLDRSVVLTTLVPCTLILLFVNSLAAIRWIMTVNRFLGTRIGLINGMSVTFKSGLFAYFLPGQLGSELGRVVLASLGKSSEVLNHAVTSALIDRMMALVSMLMMTILFLAWAVIHRYNFISLFLVSVGLFCATIASVHFGARLLRGVIFVFKKNRYVDYIGNILKMLKMFIIKRPIFCILMLACSMLLNLVVAYVTYLIVSRVFHPMSFSTVALMSLISNLSSVIPITPGGVGISEVAFRETASMMQGASIENLAGGYIIYRLINIFSYIVGLMFLGIAKNIMPKIDERVRV